MGNQQGQYQNYAYRILHIHPDSPLQNKDIQEYADYILYNPSANNDILLSEYLLKNLNKEIQLNIFNIIRQDVRSISIVPIMNKTNIIGAETRFERFDEAIDGILKVGQIFEGSAAEKSGLNENDYILGLHSRIFENLDQFQKYLLENQFNEITLVVYNSNEQVIRKVNVTLNLYQQNYGILGCELLNGIIHRIPKPIKHHKPMQIDQQQREKQNHQDNTEGNSEEEYSSSEEDHSEIMQHQEIQIQIPINNYSYVTKQEEIKVQDIKNNNEIKDCDQTVEFHRSDGKNQEFLLINA